MEKKLIVVAMDVKPPYTNGFVLDEAQVRAILAGLYGFYSEAAVWVTKRNIAVMVVGESCNLVQSSLKHFAHQFENMEILYNESAVKYFKNIADGLAWCGTIPIDKLNSLNVSLQLAMKANTMGPILAKLIVSTSGRLKHMEVIAGNRNSWNYEKDRTIEEKNSKSKIRVLRETFYRFSVN